MRLVRILGNSLVLREYTTDGSDDDEDFVNYVHSADVVELIRLEGSLGTLNVHYPYLVHGDVLIRTDLGDARIRRHKGSVCPFLRGTYIYGPLSTVKIVVQVRTRLTPSSLMRLDQLINEGVRRRRVHI